MTALDLVNDVFDKYYHNEYIPSKIGGSPETLIVRYLMAITNTIKVEQKKASISEVWVAKFVTWFTAELPQLLLLPKFPNETDQVFLQRMYDLIDAQNLGGQSSATIKAAIKALVLTAIGVAENDITIVSSSSFNEWKDVAEGYDAYWGQGFEWADTSETLNATIKIVIQFAATGASTDPTTYDYWALPANYTKIQDIVKLFKTPGITFELELLSP